MFAFIVVIVNDDHTKPAIVSKETVGVKVKEVICAEFCIFVILLSQDAFEMGSPERKS